MHHPIKPEEIYNVQNGASAEQNVLHVTESRKRFRIVNGVHHEPIVRHAGKPCQKKDERHDHAIYNKVFIVLFVAKCTEEPPERKEEKKRGEYSGK